MIRKLFLIVMLLLSMSLPARAQSGADGWTLYPLNLRTGPGMNYAVIIQLPSSTGLIFEARNADVTWLLGHSEDGALRGWVNALYIRYREGFAAVNLPVSEETIATAADVPAPQTDAPVSSGSAFDVLMSIPVVPAISGHARDIFQGSGNDPRTIIRIGDCNSEGWEFLGPFNTGDYDLGEYGYLQPTVDYFGGSFGVKNITAHGGFNIFAVTDPTWANTGQCQPNETPLACELRRHRPAVAVMMFGPNDTSHLTAAQFEASLRQVVAATIANGTIPVLTTFTWCESGSYGDLGLQFNLITVNVARENDIPLINFWRAAQGLPNCGLSDATHLSKPVMTTTGNFTDLHAGYTMRNLVTLQTLEALRTSALQ